MKTYAELLAEKQNSPYSRLGVVTHRIRSGLMHSYYDLHLRCNDPIVGSVSLVVKVQARTLSQMAVVTRGKENKQ